MNGIILAMKRKCLILTFSLNNLFIKEFIHGGVKHLELMNSMIQIIDDEAFQGLRLESLKLTDNKLSALSEKTFR